jgi:hypothetical protein
MAREANWDAVIARLQRVPSLAVIQFEIGNSVTQEDIEVLRSLNVKLPPPAIMEFFRSSNGVKLLWSGILSGQAVQGSINIRSLFESSMRVSAREGGEPLEGVLWNAEFSPRVLKDLKRMAIFEAIAGQSASLTYFVDESDSQLFLVEDDHIKPIVPDFETTIELLQLYAGADPLRKYLIYKDWQKRIGRDRILQRIAAL